MWLDVSGDMKIVNSDHLASIAIELNEKGERRIVGQDVRGERYNLSEAAETVTLVEGLAKLLHDLNRDVTANDTTTTQGRGRGQA